eukprot:gnl/MRDRNA2_/MRDRNA2_16025_c0_seq1.p1 gnl/MRDRNA2_/MRDRNA2_16025_c0~~gnl/MRDRNA2_/MRDRNA2_16025_c0_seq1.p1  ORF type:complete len:380 (-),score=79.58 gnl/MRDRNA2_/MRDRNA2_16025_c0_seq1:34-1173(-)
MVSTSSVSRSVHFDDPAVLPSLLTSKSSPEEACNGGKDEAAKAQESDEAKTISREGAIKRTGTLPGEDWQPGKGADSNQLRMARKQAEALRTKAEKGQRLLQQNVILRLEIAQRESKIEELMARIRECDAKVQHAQHVCNRQDIRIAELRFVKAQVLRETSDVQEVREKIFEVIPQTSDTQKIRSDFEAAWDASETMKKITDALSESTETCSESSISIVVAAGQRASPRGKSRAQVSFGSSHETTPENTNAKPPRRDRRATTIATASTTPQGGLGEQIRRRESVLLPTTDMGFLPPLQVVRAGSCIPYTDSASSLGQAPSSPSSRAFQFGHHASSVATQPEERAKRRLSLAKWTKETWNVARVQVTSQVKKLVRRASRS